MERLDRFGASDLDRLGARRQDRLEGRQLNWLRATHDDAWLKSLEIGFAIKGQWTKNVSLEARNPDSLLQEPRQSAEPRMKHFFHVSRPTMNY